jgi:hypothetical protein
VIQVSGLLLVQRQGSEREFDDIGPLDRCQQAQYLQVTLYSEWITHQFCRTRAEKRSEKNVAEEQRREARKREKNIMLLGMAIDKRRT